MTGGGDYTARIWDAATGELAAAPLQYRGYVIRASFSPDGRRVVTALEQGIIPSDLETTAHVWDLPRDDRPVEDLELVAQLLSGVRVDSTGSLMPLGTQTLAELWRTVRAKYPRTFPARSNGDRSGLTRDQLLAVNEAPDKLAAQNQPEAELAKFPTSSA